MKARVVSMESAGMTVAMVLKKKELQCFLAPMFLSSAHWSIMKKCVVPLLEVAARKGSLGVNASS